jgi:hypothetical protein
VPRFGRINEQAPNLCNDPRLRVSDGRHCWLCRSFLRDSNLARHAFQYDDALIELTELIAIVCGVFMLQGRNWGRWLALVWIAFHVAFSLFDSLPKAVVHGLLLVLIAYFLFRPNARAHFQHPEEMRT